MNGIAYQRISNRNSSFELFQIFKLEFPIDKMIKSKSFFFLTILNCDQ